MVGTALESDAVGMELVLDAQEVFVVRDGEPLPTEIEAIRPDVTIVEMAIAEGDGIHLTQELLERKLTKAVVIHTAFEDDLLPLAALIAGAAGVVSKRGLADELTKAVQVAARGGSVRPRITIDGLVEAAGRLNPDDIPILGMLVHGTSPAEIGEVLGIHERELAGRRRRMVRALLGGLR